jgi:hypothetical protein
VHCRDLHRLVECGYDLACLCVIRNQVSAQGDLSVRRVQQSLSSVHGDELDVARDVRSALQVAQHGMHIFTALAFMLQFPLCGKQNNL